MDIPKKVLAVHDMSGAGRCSLTVIIPTLSAMGAQVVPIPTAYFSTHTGGYSDITIIDLSEIMLSSAGHLKKEGFEFDAVYTGFLGSDKQISIVENIIGLFPEAKIVVDPVMGDGGILYKTYTPYMQERMRDLVKLADITTPNLTESAFILGHPYSEEEIGEAEVMQYLRELCEMGPRLAVITGVKLSPGKLTNYAYDSESGEYFTSSCDNTGHRFPGTGDLYTSVLLGGLLGGYGVQKALDTATGFTYTAIGRTLAAGTPIREGVLLESVLSEIVPKLGES